jgi:tetratricopeptide (TPR) repeat protein
MRNFPLNMQSCSLTSFSIAALAVALPLAGFAQAQGPANPRAVQPAAEERKPSAEPQPVKDQAVYDVLTRGTCHLDTYNDQGANWYGTGWVLDVKQRLIVTNEHVARPGEGKEAKQILAWFPVMKDGEAIHEPDYYIQNVKRIPVKIIYTDKLRDLALLQLESLPADAAAFKLSEKSAKIGGLLHSLGGWPRGSEGLFIYSQGHLRANYKRTIATSVDGQQIQVLETQMPLNKGNSGGPIVNDAGELVGVFEGLNIDSLVQLVNMCIDISEVRAFLETALPLVEPKTAAEFNQRGDYHYENARYNYALEDYNRALTLDAKSATAMSNRGWVYHQKKDPTTALAEFNAALAIEPGLMHALWGRGTLHREAGKLEESLEDFTNAIRSAKDDKDFAELHNERGNTYYAQEKYDLALADYDRAIEKNPKHAWAHANRGDALGQMKRYDEAFKSLDAAIALTPRTADGFWNIAGNLWFARERYDYAVNMYANAIQINPGEQMYYRNRGGAERLLERWQDAVNSLTKAVELDPQDADSWNELGLTWFDCGRYDQAIAPFSKAIEIDGASATYYGNRGDTYSKLGDHRKAIADLTVAIDSEDSAEYRKLRGEAYHAIGNKTAAKADFAKVAELDDSYKLYDRKYVRVLNETGKDLTVHLQYYTYTTDGKWKWFPEAPGEGEGINFSFAPGETGTLFHDDWKINASNIRIWAFTDDSQWVTYRDADLIIAPAGGYLTSEEDYEVYTVPFQNNMK